MAKVVLTSNLGAVQSAAQAQIAQALEMIGLAAEGYAKVNITENGNVDTGLLRNSITHIVDTAEKKVYIGSNVHYAPYIELGTGIYYPGGRDTPWFYTDRHGVTHATHGSHPHPFLVPAISNHLPEYQQIIKDNITK